MGHGERRKTGRSDRRDELRAPLEVIIGSGEELQASHGRGDAALRRDLERILAAARKLRDRAGRFAESENGRSGGCATARRHDIRTALNAIVGYSEILMEEAEERNDETLLAKLRVIRSSAGEFQARLGHVSPEGASPASASRTGSLLVVDDDAGNRDLLVRHLERQGHTVTAAGSGREALEILRNKMFDMILLDILMPGMSGLEVLGEIKKNDAMRDISMVMVSSIEGMEVVAESIQKGAEDYLLRPFNPVLLDARITACLEKKRLRHRDVEQRHQLAELKEALELREWREEARFIAESPVMRDVLNTAHSVSRSPVNVLIHGASGTGKEAIARMIHRCSERRTKPFIAVNCASIPENLVESEFFGYEKGAFTGAVTDRRGRFEEAGGGTLFLDEIGDMPQAIQPKLLRAIQEGEGTRLGSSRNVSYDVRIISATNKDLRREVTEGRFREDLFYRIFSVEIQVPALRERREDIVPLTMFFVDSVSRRFGKTVDGCAPELLSFFEDYPWPGNVRQLMHEVERMIALVPEGGRLSLEQASGELRAWQNAGDGRGISCFSSDTSLAGRVSALERDSILGALRQTDGNKTRAAKLLGLTRQGLDKKIKRLGI